MQPIQQSDQRDGRQHAPRLAARARQLLAAVCVSILATSPVVFAQSTTGGIVGVVTDSTGSALPGVTVTVTNLGTNDTRTIVTDAGGRYQFPLLPVGRYSVKAELTGFRPWTVSELSLAAGDTRTLDAELAIGGTQEVVEVTAEAPVLQRQSSTIMSLIDQTAVQDLPLNGRNFVSLAQLAPGAANTTIGFSQGGLDDRRLSSQLTVNGQYTWANNHMIDGMDNNERFIGTIIVKPSVEAVQEMRMQTNLYSADIGRTAGGVVNLITKSGTNSFRGSLYNYLRNERFDAKGYFELEKLPYRQFQAGGSLGGPIMRDRVFFFADYERLDITQGQNFIGTVPTVAMRQGNFAGVARIFDPLTTQCQGRNCTRVEFPGQQIPADRIDPVGARILALYPLPTNDQLTNNYNASDNRTTVQDTADARVDVRVSDRQFMYVRYSWSDLFAYAPNPLEFGNRQTSNQASHGLQVNFVQTLSDRTVLEYRGGWSRYDVASLPYLYGQNVSADLGIRNANFNLLSSGLANITPTGYLALGSGTFVPQLNTNDVFQGGAVLTNQLGAHSLKVGVDVRQRLLDQAQSGTPRGAFTFNGVLTQDNPQAPGAGTGHPIASLLLGYPSNASRSAQTVEPKYRFTELSGFVQDDWRVQQWLTVNLGVRYDYFSPLTEKDNNISNFDFETGRIVIAGRDGVSRTAGVRKDWMNLAPRLGFAATVLPTTVVRGGYGISFVPPFMGTPGALRNPPFLSLYSSPTAVLTPSSDIAGALPPFEAADPLNPIGNIWATGFDGAIPYVHQFNLTAHHELAGGFVAGVSYVGQRGKKQYFPNSGPNFNAPPPGDPATLTERRPYYSTVPGATAIAYYGPIAETRYNALQLTVERRFRGGLGATANYTLAKAEDSFDFFPTEQGRVFLWGPSNLDVRHRLSATANYHIPLARTATGLLAALAQGWQLNLIAQWQTSVPINVTNATDVSGTGVGSRPNLVGDPILPKSERTPARWFNTAAFVRQPTGTEGNTPRNLLRGPDFAQLDLALTKSFRVRGDADVRLTIQAFNLLDRVNFSTPSGAFGTGAFGTITSAQAPRQMQFALKLTF